ncbi:MAG TPA: DUF1835 domain-containing protein [Longimicrobium sp.]|nr:DUF1835 domain-containing protein [Longimicrobium sp.]
MRPSPPQLHVTNGDAAAEALRAAGITDPILPWRDVLHEGPVPAGLSLEALSEVRSRFIAGEGWAAEDEARASFAQRDQALARAAEYGEVVLWFEHDLYDQLQLIQVLDWFAEHPHPRKTLVNPAEYLGPLPPARVIELYGSRLLAEPEQLQQARAAWAAFRDPDPRALERLIAGGTGALPHLAAALRRHLEQFPGTRDGLSRSERQALQVLEDGPQTVGDAYVASHHEREDAVFLGDGVFADYLAELGSGDAPLVAFEDGSPLRAPAGPEGSRDFFARRIAMTDAGRDVLAGRADRVRLNGIDRWLGGVHLEGRESAWRWDPAKRRLTAP